jgi:hypothetical protein
VLAIRSPCAHKPSGTILEALITDGTDYLSVTFFNQKWRERDFRWVAQAVRRQCLPGHPPAGPSSASCSLMGRGRSGAVAAFAGALIPIYPAPGSPRGGSSRPGIVLDQMPELPVRYRPTC